MKILTALLLAFVCVQAAQAASPAEPSFRILSGKAEYPWSEGLSISLEIDEKACKAAYGQKWRQKCAASPGRPGQAAKGIAMLPEADGYWQWRDGQTLQFVPSGGASIKAGESYEADLSELSLPPSIKLAGQNIIIKTPPLSVRPLALDFYINPSPGGAHRLSCAVEFNYPVYNDPNIQILPSEGLAPGDAETAWSGERDRLNISWPLRRLSEKPGKCAVLFPGFWLAARDNGAIKYSPPAQGARGALFRKNLPAADKLFYIKSASLEDRADASLDSRLVLRLDASLYAYPDELLKNLYVFELPKFNSDEGREPYDWSLAPALPPEILAKARRITPIKINKGNQPQTRLEFEIPAERGRYILCGASDKFTSASGQKMAGPWADILYAAPASPEIGFLQPGNVLSAGGGGELELFAREVDEIAWKVQLVRDPFLAVLASSSWDSFSSPLQYSGMDIASFSTAARGKIKPKKRASGSGLFASLRLAEIVEELKKKAGNEYGGGLAMISLKGIKNGEEAASARRLALLSDIGLIVKRQADGSMRVFARDLDKKRPASGLDVRVLSINGMAAASGKTDSEGQATLPSLSGLGKEEEPAAVIAGDESRFAWLPLNDASRRLNYSDFNISGSHIGPNDLNVYVFSRQGAYRPGDETRFGCIVRKGNMDPAPDGLPLFAEIVDPRGVQVWSKVFKAPSPGLADLSWTLPLEALSGRWTLNIKTAEKGAPLQSLAFMTREFQPETMKLKISPPSHKGWLRIKDLKSSAEAAVFLQNLYGTPARGHKIKACLELMPAEFKFKGFEEYFFAETAPSPIKRRLPDIITDKGGAGSLKLPSDILAGRAARAVISAEGFSAGGGRAVAAQCSFLTSPMPYLLGFKLAGEITDLQYIPKGARGGLNLIAVNPELETAALKNLRFSLSKTRLASSLVSDGNGGYKYEERPVEELVKEWSASLGREGLDLSLETDEPGSRVLRIEDADGLLLNTIAYNVIGDALQAPETSPRPSKMRMRLSKKNALPGEKIQLALSLPYDGCGLITLEREGVEAWRWFDAKAGDSVQDLEIPASFEGKGWITVNFIRDNDSERVYISPLSYCVEGVTASPKKRDMGLKISAPEKASPGGNLKIRLSAKEKGKAVLFAADEGVLLLSAYENPDPIKALLGERGLDVVTLSAIDLLMPSQGLKKRLSAFGGGMDGSAFGARFQNPFKRKNEEPMAAWLADLDVSPEGAELSLPIPDYYNGQIRIIAVGVSDNGAGSDIARTVIAAPFLISPQLPLYVSPGDEFTGGLLLANNGSSDEKRELRIENAAGFEILAADPPSVNLEAGGEALWKFRLKALDGLGAHGLSFAAKSGGNVIKRRYPVSIRPASSISSKIQAGSFSGKEMLPPSPQVYPELASSEAVISSLPLALARSLGRYLMDYPYGCTEQLLSRSFAAALLAPWAPEKDSGKTLQACLDACRSRLANNGLAFWPNGDGDLLLSAYAADFLLSSGSAAGAGSMPLLGRLCEILAENCSLNDSTLDAARASAYAIWILTREGRVTSQLLEELLAGLRERRIPGWENDITALLIAASQKEMRMRRAISIESVQYSPSGIFDELAQESLHMALAAKYFPESLDEDKKRAFFEECAAALNNNNFATFSAAQAVRAVIQLGGAAEAESLAAGLACPGAEEEPFSWANGAALSLKTDFCPQYEVSGNPEGLFWQIITSGYDREASQKPLANGIVVEKEYVDMSGNAVTSPEIGQELIARVRARSESGPVSDCVISDILPGGLEMIMDAKDGDGLPDAVKFIDMKEDRALIFTDLDARPLEFTYRVRAASEGTFTIPPASAEAMYDRSVSGRSASGKMIIRHE